MAKKETEASLPTFKPSDVTLRIPPLCNTMKRAEVEFAASLIVRTLQVKGDAWRPVEWSEIQEVIKADMAEDREPFASLMKNPVFRPDAPDLVKRGYARWLGEPRASAIELLPPAFEAIGMKWVPREKKKKADTEPPPIEMAIDTVAKLGFEVGDVLVSEAWDLPYQLTKIDPSVAEISVDRLVPAGNGTWRPTVTIVLKYLPRDVRVREEVPPTAPEYTSEEAKT
jgi:hypothetical protein